MAIEMQAEQPRGAGFGGEMTLVEHLKELRNRLMVAGIVLLVCVVASFIFWERILEFLMIPGRDAWPADRGEFRLVNFGPTDTFFLAMKIALYSGVILSTPVAVYEIMAFVVPGLTANERKLILPALFGTAFFLLLGMSFAYYVILPASLNFLFDFGNQQVETIPQATLYINFALRIIFWVDIAFELPMVIALLARLGLVTARKVLSFWRYAIVLIFILAAVITPTPDPITQTFVAGPLIVLYVVGIFLAWMVQPRKKEPESV
jgi:sec-independent protein translocase protein TatC